MIQLPAINTSILTADEIREIIDYVESIETTDYLPDRIFDAIGMGVTYSLLRSNVSCLEENPNSYQYFNHIDRINYSDSKLSTYLFMGMMLGRRKNRNGNYLSEKNYHSFMVSNFNRIFPEYIFVDSEFSLSGEDRDRVDILAKEIKTDRPVIIELKVGSISAHKQLRSYAYHFKNPILVNVSESLPKSRREGIIYRTYEGLGISSSNGNLEIAKLWGEK